MFKKMVITIVVLTSMVYVSSAWSSVVGTWNVEGKMKIKMTIKGGPTEKESGYIYDVFTFYPTGDFEMTDMEGVWIQTDKKFTINIDNEDIETYFEDELWYEYGIDAGLEVTKNLFNGKEDKNGESIKGKYELNMDVYYYDYGLEGKLSTTWNYNGIWAYASDSSYLDEDNTLPLPGSVLQAIGEKLRQLE